MITSHSGNFRVRTYPALLTARGIVNYVEIRPDRWRPTSWICDACFQRVLPSKMEKHARDHS